MKVYDIVCVCVCVRVCARSCVCVLPCTLHWSAVRFGFLCPRWWRCFYPEGWCNTVQSAQSQLLSLSTRASSSSPAREKDNRGSRSVCCYFTLTWCEVERCVFHLVVFHDNQSSHVQHYDAFTAAVACDPTSRVLHQNPKRAVQPVTVILLGRQKNEGNRGIWGTDEERERESEGTGFTWASTYWQGPGNENLSPSKLM